ncbi:MAG TPA: C-GCAxxG-C-C family protein [Anaeromyxobacteraceae bacterium]|nr:C-GCAxxG-C-C family protein [Anaeromyxobacteraceae bacterium]
MGDEQMRMMELSLKGYGCSQILVLLALEAWGKENPDLVRAISGLHGGLGYSGRLCGALAGGCCVLALHSGKGTAGEAEDVRQNPMIGTLVDWFEEQYRPQYGGIDCANIVGDDARNQRSRCPSIVFSVFEKVREILAAHGYDLAKDPHAST